MQIKEAESPHLDENDHYLRQVEMTRCRKEEFIVRMQNEYWKYVWESLSLSKFKLNSFITFEFGLKTRMERLRVFRREGRASGVGYFLERCPLMDRLLFRECSLICEMEQKCHLLKCEEETSRRHGPWARLCFPPCQNARDTIKHFIRQTFLCVSVSSSVKSVVWKRDAFRAIVLSTLSFVLY